MNHRFYLKSVKKQKQIQIAIALISLFTNLCILGLCMLIGMYFLPLISAFLTLSIIAPFFDVPSLKKSGKLLYYSPLFIAEKEKNGLIIIHGGSLFDYLFAIDNRLNGAERTNFILQNYLEGVLNLIEANEKKAILL